MTAASLDFLPMLWLCHWADNLCISLQEYIAPVLMLLAGFMYVTVWGGKKELYIICNDNRTESGAAGGNITAKLFSLFNCRS